ncbi:uncharacterized protein P174DRAFT_304617 [Aspergillus novofumigatus IBT 16806]|uniref:Uncharacterized protein n=1 Tax=Aspergillus novofumigatus (strain IBT 16806) TaxID=1392255 RepID=A0A2I1BWD4_ASPN1|nr:uncharacterized protein P174DRAFT_304617 [Aspergillus novofumigatus IBT 16806]PKX89697.1 hypothetical protein P174DRAFT_304617 [Aspergillus novofumigatus IBT 16806]
MPCMFWLRHSEKSIFSSSFPNCAAVMFIVHTARSRAYPGIGPKVRPKSRGSQVLAQTGILRGSKPLADRPDRPGKGRLPLCGSRYPLSAKKCRLFSRSPVTNYNFQHLNQVKSFPTAKTIAMPLADCTAFPHLSPTGHPIMTPDYQDHSDSSILDAGSPCCQPQISRAVVPLVRPPVRMRRVKTKRLISANRCSELDSAVIGSCAKPRIHLTICSQVQAHKKVREP